MIPRSPIRFLAAALCLGLAVPARADAPRRAHDPLTGPLLRFPAAASAGAPRAKTAGVSERAAGPTSVVAPGRVLPRPAPPASHTIAAPSDGPASKPGDRTGDRTTGGGGNGFGTAFSTLGDAFGDGLSDFAVGAPYVLNPSGTTGQVLVYNAAPGTGIGAPKTLYSQQANNGYGQSVAGVGDVNGDGFGDLLVGAPFQTSGGHTNCGRAVLYLGTSSGYLATPSWTFDTLEDGAGVGLRVAWAGDVNRDGYDDWLVAAPYHTDGQTFEGAVYLFYGGSGALSTTPVWTQESDVDMAYFGWSISTAGDVNGDGYSDFLVGAPGDQYPLGKAADEGSLYLFAGGPGMPQHVPARKFYGGQFNAQLGSSAAAAGDVNGDGYADFLAGAPFFGDDQINEGIANLYLGGPVFALIATPIQIEGSIANAEFGYSVGTAGDINGDGFADILIGAILVPQGSGQGAAYVYLGNESGGYVSPYDEFDASAVNETMGIWVGTLGDITGDGRGEYAAGAPSATGDGHIEYHAGQAFPISSVDQVGGQGGFDGATFGVSGATADVDGDGYDDLIIGTPNGGGDGQNRGSVTLFRGGPRPFQQAGPYPFLGAAPDWTYVGGQAFEIVGTALSTAGDVNADGYEDFISGGYEYSNGESVEGEALLFYGSPSGPLGSPIWQTEGNEVLAYHGYSVAGGGDLNGDGFDDVAVGEPGADGPIGDEGAVAVYLGSALGAARVPVVRLIGGQASAEFGVSCAIVGDINRDGYDDLAVGAPFWADPDAGEGRVLIFLGSSTGVHSPPSQEIQLNVAGAEFGYNLARIGDVNGDGYADLAVGAPYFTNGQSQEGEVLVYYGSPGGLVTPAGWSLEGDEIDRNLGTYGLAGAGDQNNDGYGDLFVGSPYTDGGGMDVGRIQIFPGGPSGLDTTPFFDLTSVFSGIYLGVAVGGMADFNGDGASDLYYSAPDYSLAYATEGVVAIRYGNMFDLNSFNPDQPVAAWRTDALAPVSPGLRSNANNAFSLHARGRSPAGRTRLKLEWEAKPQSTPFDFAGRGSSAWQSMASVVPGNGTSAAFASNVSGLATGTRYHWRARARSSSPLFPWTPWVGNERVGESERMIVTGGVPGVVAVDPPAAEPGPLALAGAAPNPFTDSAALAFTLPRAGHAVLALYDVHGRLVRTVFEGAAPAGRTNAAWDGRDDHGRAAPAGAYFSRLTFGNEERIGKVVRLR
jgi:hypothetical protein